MSSHILDPAARDFGARKVLDDVQAAPIGAIEQAIHVLRKALGRG